MRGITATFSSFDSDAGLSPRVRGNRLRMGFDRQVERSIPACAGESCSMPEKIVAGWVYPRVCGGIAVAGCVNSDCEGLSPRVRGNLILLVAGVLVMWSIPACAGESYPARSRRPRYVVYPRVCGGIPPFPKRPPNTPGLSPRVRGESHGRGPDLKWIRVYPRVCGGIAGRPAAARRTGGLSPRVRGNHVGLGDGVVKHRSIPACAGESAQAP